MVKAYSLQQLLNYFDETDDKVRQVHTTLDAQLLNGIALQLDDLELSVRRETGAALLTTNLAQLDNRGVWYATAIPNSFPLPDDPKLPTVEGRNGSTWSTLTEFNELSPVPSSMEVDTEVYPVPMTDPVILDLTGGQRLQTVEPGQLVLPNRLSFWLEGLGTSNVVVDIHIEGERYPQPLWMSERKRSDESLYAIYDGYLATLHPWARIDRITVRNLPAGARLRCWVLPVTLPAVPEERAYTDAGVRDVVFPRLWQGQGYSIQECYHSGNFGGLVEVQSYQSANPITGLVPEPNTWNMYLASQRRLLVIDRRELMPEHLDDVGLLAEPVYGLQVTLNDSQSTDKLRCVDLIPQRNRSVASRIPYRWTIQDPGGRLYSLTSTGQPIAYKASSNWLVGRPQKVTYTMLATGTYVFTLESQLGAETVMAERVPFRNHLLTPLASFDLSPFLSGIEGLAFDFLGRLWAWTGNFAIPLRPRYHAFTLDRAARTLYVTDSYEDIRLS